MVIAFEGEGEIGDNVSTAASGAVDAEDVELAFGALARLLTLSGLPMDRVRAAAQAGLDRAAAAQRGTLQ